MILPNAPKSSVSLVEKIPKSSFSYLNYVAIKEVSQEKKAECSIPSYSTGYLLHENSSKCG